MRIQTILTLTLPCVVFAKRPYFPLQARLLGIDQRNTAGHCSVPWIGVAYNNIDESQQIVVESCRRKDEVRDVSLAQQHRSVCNIGCHDVRMDPGFVTKPDDQKVNIVECNCASEGQEYCTWQAKWTGQWTGGNLVCKMTRYNVPGFFRSEFEGSNAMNLMGPPSYPTNLVQEIAISKKNKKSKIDFDDEHFTVVYQHKGNGHVIDATFEEEDGFLRYPVGVDVEAVIKCKKHSAQRYFMKVEPWCKADRFNAKKKVKKMSCAWLVTEVWNNKMSEPKAWFKKSGIKNKMDKAVLQLMQNKEPWTCPE
jgi:hypothetical protein